MTGPDPPRRRRHIDDNGSSLVRARVTARRGRPGLADPRKVLGFRVPPGAW